ncbi:MAG: hypothetical protein ACJAU9_001207 [Lentimonas sp.]|jgi:hypothetical protein
MDESKKIPQANLGDWLKIVAAAHLEGGRYAQHHRIGGRVLV